LRLRSAPTSAATAEPTSTDKPDETVGKAVAFDSDGDIRSLADVEAEMIRLALARYQGRMTIIARKLGIGRSTLYRKLKDLGISDTVAGIAAE
jgi:transcriptional regulator of acetoin/glycerol metabolism